MEDLFASFGLKLIQVAVASLIGAVFIRAAAQWVVKLDVAYGKAYATFFLIAFCNHLLAFGLGLVAGAVILAAGVESEAGVDIAVGVAALVSIPLGLLVAGGILSFQLELPYIRGLLVALVTYAVAIGVAIVVALIIFAAFFLFGINA